MARDYGIYPKYVVRPGGVTFRSKAAAVREARDGGASYVENLDTGRVVWERTRKKNASKRKVRRRVAKALKKYVRGNAGRMSMRKSKKAIKKAKAAGRSSLLRAPGGNYRPFSRASTGRLRTFNPRRVKGRKTKGGRAVTLKNFTGTIVKKSDGTVQIVGRGRRK